MRTVDRRSDPVKLADRRPLVVGLARRLDGDDSQFDPPDHGEPDVKRWPWTTAEGQAILGECLDRLGVPDHQPLVHRIKVAEQKYGELGLIRTMQHQFCDLEDIL